MLVFPSVLFRIIGWREAAQLSKAAVTQAYLNRDLPLRQNNVVKLITLAMNANRKQKMVES